ncbi:hypothetical protein [Leptolyngbya sp. FACHB-16]|uniref:hypothetical protein n=1 Tax=unclassified Leptolyngbya TaxID=2650499 RepID=UPI00168400EB|nr:hypothetical protein [Leptolyngbya sp. FACHB-16]MBD2153166.1 hypothetical protein [Leptolyngbya sp. FACHB-16]
MAGGQVSPRGFDKRTRTMSLRLQLETELFYAASGEFTLEASTTRAMEQYLMARARDRDNVASLAHTIRTRAILLNKTPVQVLAEWLERTGDYKFLESYTTAAIALCTLWDINPDDALPPKSE